MNPAAARETLAGQSAVVTGGARGIGAAIAGALARAGAQIWLLDHDEDALRAAAAAIGARAIVADVRDHAAMIAAAERVAREDGRIDVLVNNAGLIAGGGFDETGPDAWRALLDTNVGGIYNGVQAFVPRMGAGARIVNIASVSSERGGGAVGNVWYGATKAAVVAITKGLARELGPRGIRVNAISPGLVDTALTREALTPAVRARALTRFPLGRITEADDVARVALFLCSPAAAFVSGAVLPVDGGFLTT